MKITFRPRQRIALGMAFCLMNGMLSGSAATMLDLGNIDTGRTLGIVAFVMFALVCGYLYTVCHSVNVTDKSEDTLNNIGGSCEYDPSKKLFEESTPAPDSSAPEDNSCPFAPYDTPYNRLQVPSENKDDSKDNIILDD